MSDAIYVGMSGAEARAEQLDAISDNLANVHTPGFKAARPAFESFLPKAGTGDQQYVGAVGSGLDLRAGPRQHTGGPLDVALEDGAFLAVETAPGARGYTRNGALTVDGAGTLRSEGRPVLGASGGAITVPPNAKVELQPDGRVMANGAEVDRLATFKLSGRVERLAGSVVAPGTGGSAEPTPTRVQVGELEGGNYSALEATVDMVSAQRSYDAAMQAIDVYRKLSDRANEVGRVR